MSSDSAPAERRSCATLRCTSLSVVFPVLFYHIMYGRKLSRMRRWLDLALVVGCVVGALLCVYQTVQSVSFDHVKSRPSSLLFGF